MNRQCRAIFIQFYLFPLPKKIPRKFSRRKWNNFQMISGYDENAKFLFLIVLVRFGCTFISTYFRFECVDVCVYSFSLIQLKYYSTIN